jgi:4-hydroxybenzoate polyprenyltransferase
MAQENDSRSLDSLTFIQFVNTFSLMVVAGSVSTAFFFVRYFKADLPLSFYWILGSGVWMIYTIDHLRDGIRLKDRAVFLRHSIHYKYRQILVPSLVALAAFNAILIIFFFDQKMIVNGLILGSFVLLYFILFYAYDKHNVHWLKEIFVALMVAAGMVIYPGICGNMSLTPGSVIIVSIFAVLNYTNLLLFGYFDLEGDRKNQMHSMAMVMGKDKALQWIYQLLALIFTLLIIYAFFVPNTLKISATISILVMLNILLVITLFEEKSSKKEIYRFWGDFIYVIPGLIWLFISHEKLF